MKVVVTVKLLIIKTLLKEVTTKRPREYQTIAGAGPHASYGSYKIFNQRPKSTKECKVEMCSRLGTTYFRRVPEQYKLNVSFLTNYSSRHKSNITNYFKRNKTTLLLDLIEDHNMVTLKKMIAMTKTIQLATATTITTRPTKLTTTRITAD